MRIMKIAIAACCLALMPSGRAFATAICGDLDGDSIVSANDSMLVNRFAAGLDGGAAPGYCRASGILQCGDVNKDGLVDHADWLHVEHAAAGIASPCSVEGFAASTNRVAGDSALSYYVVTNTNDSSVNDVGSLRWALNQARTNNGGLIVFNLPVPNDQTITAQAVLGGFKVPPNTVIDGSGSMVMIDGMNIANNGTLNVYNSNIAVRHIRVRNAGDDGIQVAPKDLTDNISNIAIQHVSVTKSGDGGIDVDGCVGLTVTGCTHDGGITSTNGTTSNVTLADNLIAANGTVNSPSSVDGGGNLTKYGVTNVTMVGNFWEKNAWRDPTIDNRGGSTNFQIGPESLVDVRSNLARSPYRHWVEVFGTTAKVNVVDSCFEGASTLGTTVMIRLGTGGVGGAVFVKNNQRPPSTTETSGTPSANAFGPVPCVTKKSMAAVFNEAGAAPRDAADLCYIQAADYNDAISTCFF
jgi:hypothetical protein